MFFILFPACWLFVEIKAGNFRFETARTASPCTHSHSHTLLNDADPGAPVIPGCRVDLVHLRRCRTDQKHPFLLVSDVPHDEILQ